MPDSKLDQIKSKLDDELFQYLEEWQQQLLSDSVNLASLMKDQEHFFDYSAMVFPASKAYEGFLKQYLRDLGLITKEAYLSKRFRIGRALNPDIRKSQRDEWWLYDDLERMCSKELGRKVWDTWLTCRNQVFHYFPAKPHTLDFNQACDCVNTILDTMLEALSCRWHTDESEKKGEL